MWRLFRMCREVRGWRSCLDELQGRVFRWGFRYGKMCLLSA